MTTAAILPPRMRKEIRGLLPAWLASLVVMAFAAVFGGRLQPVGLIAYFIGAVALGALSIGHEYSGRTLTLLLSQPVRRERLFVDKMSVLTGMLLTLGAVSFLNVFDLGPWDSAAQWTHNWWTLPVVLPLVCGLFLAPWLTMVCRSAPAGIVFSIAIPATLWLAGSLASSVTYGDEASLAEASNFAFEMFWRGITLVSVLAAASGWRLFMRLEAVDSRGLELNLPAWLPGRAERAGSAAATPALAERHAVWRAMTLLAKKELRLQQLTIALSGLYVAGWIAVLLFGPISPATRTTLLYTLTIFHTGVIPFVAGSLASAEERQLGTIEWQILLPMPAWWQWLMKAGAALGLALTLTLGLPALLLYFNASPAIRDELRLFTSASLMYAIVPAVVMSLYVSSLCANGLRALLISVPAALLVTGFAAPLTVHGHFTIFRTWQYWLTALRVGFDQGEIVFMTYTSLMNVLVALTYLGALGLLLRFGLANHRSAERGAMHVWKQMTALVALLAIGLTLWGGAYRLYAGHMDELNRVRRLQLASVSGVALDSRNRLTKDFEVVIFRDIPEEHRAISYSVPVNSQGEFDVTLRPGLYSFVAVRKLEQGVVPRDPELLGRLKSDALPLRLTAGEQRALCLLLSQF